jgi:hypothetical protein
MIENSWRNVRFRLECQPDPRRRSRTLTWRSLSSFGISGINRAFIAYLGARSPKRGASTLGATKQGAQAGSPRVLRLPNLQPEPFLVRAFPFLGIVRMPEATSLSCARPRMPVGLLEVPADVLRHCIFRRPGLDGCMLAVCRLVCKKFRSLISSKEPGLALGFRAAYMGYGNVLRWLHNRSPQWLDSSVCRGAAIAGRLDILQWARQAGIPWDNAVCEAASAAGHLHVVRWAHENGAPWNEYSCGAAATRHARLNMLEWLRTHDAPVGQFTCCAAAAAGKLDALQWALANGAQWDEQTCALAAYGGHLAVLQWARSMGAPWDSRTCRNAACAGNLEVLQWARENGCAWSKKECLVFARSEEMRKWIEQQPA